MKKQQQQLDSKIQDLLESFASQLTQIVRQTALEHVEVALGSVGAAPARGRAPKVTIRMGSAARKPKGGKRSSEQIGAMQEQLLAYLKKNPGHRGEQISAAMRTDTKTIRLPLKALIAAKKVKTKGQRRGMTYFAA